MLRSLSVAVFLLVLAAIPAAAQTTDPNPPPPASQTQNPPASADAKKPKKVLTNEDLSNSTGKISVVGNGQNKQITDLKNFQAGEPSTNASGVQLDRRYEREPIEVQIRALQDKKKDLQAKLDALYDEARKKGVEPGELP